MSVFLDTTTGIGLAGATGVRPFLPPLLAGALARGDIGIDFDGTDWRFLESTGFLLAVLALGVIAYLVERSEAGRTARRRARRDRDLLRRGGRRARRAAVRRRAGRRRHRELARPDRRARSAPLLGWRAVGGLVERARARLEGGAAALLTAYADAAALLLAAVAIFLPPVSFLAIAAFVVLLVGGRRREGEKYAGLRILR